MSGLIYTATAIRMVVPVAGANIWEIQATLNTSLLVRTITISFLPIFTYAGGGNVISYANVTLQTLTGLGSGGIRVNPAPQETYNTVAAVTTFNSLVTTPGTTGTVLHAASPSLSAGDFAVLGSMNSSGYYQICPRPMSGGEMLGVFVQPIVTGTPGPITMTSVVEFEEF
jgi:hypothetical protein